MALDIPDGQIDYLQQKNIKPANDQLIEIQI